MGHVYFINNVPEERGVLSESLGLHAQNLHQKN
jgi:hypothetical protein